MSYRILLVDNELKIVEHIINNTNWTISVLITEKISSCLQNDRIEKMYVFEEFLNNTDMTFFDYSELNQLWKAQLKVENCYNRFSTDFQMGKWFYYRGYALVRQIFSLCEFDFVIIKGMNHGYTWDRLISEYATFKGIRSYNIECMLNNTRIVYDNLNKKMLQIAEKNELKNTVFYKTELHSMKKLGSGIWGRIYNFTYKRFGALGLDIVKCIRYRNIGTDVWKVSTIERVRFFKEVRRVKKYYDRISSPLNKGEKYIYFSLHFEPEAVVAGRCDMDSQIAAIQMISNHLPDGWKLVVKEHPLQFQINTMLYYSFLVGTYKFKSKLFYKTLYEMKNVKFLNLETDVKEIINHSQGVASMSGTAISESIILNKPTLVFGEERTVYQYCDGIYRIHSDNECEQAIMHIRDGKKSVYSNYKSICDKYLIDFSDEYLGFEKAVRTVKREVMGNR